MIDKVILQTPYTMESKKTEKIKKKATKKKNEKKIA